MSNHFTLTETETSVNEAVGLEQIDMVNRLVEAKQDINALKGTK